MIVGIEGLDGFDLVTEQIEPQWQRGSHRKEIDQTAPNAELARLDHLRHMLVAGTHHLRAQPRLVQALATIEAEAVGGEERRWRQALADGVRRRQQDICRAGLQGCERRQSFADEVLMRRQCVVGQRLPVGQQSNPRFRCEPGDLLAQALRIQRRCTKDRQRPAALRMIEQSGKQQRISRPVGRGQGAMSADARPGQRAWYDRRRFVGAGLRARGSLGARSGLQGGVGKNLR